MPIIRTLPPKDPLASPLPNQIILSPAERISTGFAPVQKKLHDLKVRLMGQRVALIRIEAIEDKFFNMSQLMTKNIITHVLVNWPDQEFRANSFTNIDTNTTSSSLVHLYDLLPLTCHTQFKDNVRIRDIIIFKMKMIDGGYQDVVLQMIDAITKSTVSDVVYLEFQCAPPTDSVLLTNPNYQKILTEFKTTDLWNTLAYPSNSAS
jgi:hypothetical protein